MEHRKNRNLWLKLAGVSVFHSILVSFAFVFWQLHVASLPPVDNSDIVWWAISSVTGWGIFPAIISLFLLGRLYGLNFFKALRHSRDWAGDMAARFFAAFFAVASGQLLMSFVVLPVIGGEMSGVHFTFGAVASGAVGAMLLASCIVFAERAQAEEASSDANGAGA